MERSQKMQKNHNFLYRWLLQFVRRQQSFEGRMSVVIEWRTNEEDKTWSQSDAIVVDDIVVEKYWRSTNFRRRDYERR
jgi:hypothetical protein